MGLLEIYGTAFLVVLVFVSLVWAISVPLADASIVDIFWGPLFVAIGWTLLATSDAIVLKPYLVTLLVTLWGLRLAFHLAARNLGRGEDSRYQRWRERGGSNWWLVSYYRVYLFQGAIALVVATPIVAAYYAPYSFGFLNALGVLVWALGFAIEMLADIQLTRFRAEPGNGDRLLDSGLWALSRHPNYFGDALQWWGLALVAFTPATWWALVGPLAMTAVFLGISNGVLERGMRRRHGDYDQYVARTSSFVPLRRRNG
jgi:steroid 5-alpha reductase family enzyme